MNRSTRPLLLLALLGACSPMGGVSQTPAEKDSQASHDTQETEDTSKSKDSDSPDSELDTTVKDSDSAQTDTEPPPVEDIGSGEDSAAWLFTTDHILAVDIGLSSASMASLRVDPYSYVPADLSINGVSLRNVGIRLKGRIGSYRSLDGKASFRVHFNEYVEDQRYYGLEHLTLNSEVVDPSFLKTHLAYKLYREAGVPASRTGYAWIRVNGAIYGLYANIETQDEIWLRRNYPDPSGNLYDGKYIWYADGSYTLLDFDTSTQDLFELEEGTDVGRSDIHAITEALDTTGGTASFYAETSLFIDWEELWLQVAVEQWVGQNDGYTLNKNNYRVYFDPLDGKAEIIPWDLDYSFLRDSDWGMSWTAPAGRIYALCRQDGGCRSTWRRVAGETCELADSLDLSAEIDTVTALINDHISEDPRKEYSLESCLYYQDLLRTYVLERSAAVRSFWSL